MEKSNNFFLTKLLFAMALIFSVSVYAQNPVREKQDNTLPYILDTIAPNQIDTVYPYVPKWAAFPGGDEALRGWLYKRIKYPMEAQERNIQGKVFVKFIVRYDGSIDKIGIAKSVHPLLDNEAIRLVKAMPKWIPAQKNGKNVSSYFTLPITFALK